MGIGVLVTLDQITQPLPPTPGPLKCSSPPFMVENPSHLELNPCVIAYAVRISSRSSFPGAWWTVSDRNEQDHKDDLLDFYLQTFIPLSSSPSRHHESVLWKWYSAARCYRTSPPFSKTSISMVGVCSDARDAPATVPSSLTDQGLGERRTPLPRLTEARRPVWPGRVLSFKITGLEMQSSLACLMGKVWLFECTFRRLAGFWPHVFIAAFQNQPHLS